MCMCAGSSRDTAGEIHHPRISLGHKGGQLAGRHARIHTAGPSPYPAAGQHQGHMLGAILGRDQHPIAHTHLAVPQLGFQCIHHMGQLAHGDHAIRQIKKGVTRVFLDTLIKEVMNAGRVHALFKAHAFGHFSPQSMLSPHPIGQVRGLTAPNYIALLDPAFAQIGIL